MQREIITIAAIIISLTCNVKAQYNQQQLYSDLDGNELLEKVVDEYKATILFFDYGTTRDTMFREVYAVNDSLECVYTGHKLYMDPEKDPTTTVFMNGADNGINTEHTYPRSKGAGSGNARSDMHHLFPTRAMVNEERSNFPFAEIPDEEATKWFWKDQTLIDKPDKNLDLYSEWRWQKFEPRESFKGNIARAVMYFYTMYKTQADMEDPDYFWDMLPDLCQWHFSDPVDSAEYTRTNLIAKWQQYPNPFVIDCSLASRSYCKDIVDDACELAVPVKETKASGLSITYNRIREEIILDHASNQLNQPIFIDIFTADGQKVVSKKIEAKEGSSYNVSFLDRGAYIARVQWKGGLESIKFIKN